MIIKVEKLVLTVFLFGLTSAALAGEGRDVYKQACAVCHSTGVPGAPQLGDSANWTSRLGAGRQALLRSVREGRGAMPPKGGDASLSDVQVEAQIKNMR